MINVEIVPLTSAHIDGFWQVLGSVARERKYLLFTESLPLERVRESVAKNSAYRNPQFVAIAGNKIVGWCDVCRDDSQLSSHCGTLGIGILPAFRGQGLGRRLLETVIAAARDINIVRIELTAHANNTRAIALYEKVGFVHEGVKRDAIYLDGQFIDSVIMARIDEVNRADHVS